MRRSFSRRRWILPVASCVVFTVVAFLVALRYTLPYPELARSLEARLRANGIDASIQGLGPGPLLGVRATRVTFTLRYAGDVDRKAELRDVVANVSLANLLRFHLRGALDALAFGGRIHADWPLLSANAFSAEWDDVDLRRLPLPPSVAAAGVRGFVRGTASATRPDGRATWDAGAAEANITDARIGPGHVVGFPLPALSLGTGTLRVSLRDGKVVVQDIRFEGGNLSADVKGTVGMNVPFPTNPVEGALSLRADERATTDLGLFLSLFPGGRRTDGTYRARFAGSLGSLRLIPSTRRR